LSAAAASSFCIMKGRLLKNKTGWQHNFLGTN
jgi:hypothetical protein